MLGKFWEINETCMAIYKTIFFLSSALFNALAYLLEVTLRKTIARDLLVD
jgi:hypothetical protein